MVGLDVIGRKLLLNMAEHAHFVGGYDKDAQGLLAQGHSWPLPTALVGHHEKRVKNS